MITFDYSSAAEVYLARHSGRGGVKRYMRFPTAAGALKFVMEELSASSIRGLLLEVDEMRFDLDGIRALYQSVKFPLPRNPQTR